MPERDQFAAGVGSGIYGSGEPLGNIIFNSPAAGTPGGVPAQPSSFTASDNLFTDKILLTWTAAAEALKYELYRNDVLLLETQNTSYEDTTAIPGFIYLYTLIAKNNTGNSTASVDNGSRKVSGVENLTAIQNLQNKIVLSWSKIPNVNEYRVYRGTNQNFSEMIPLQQTTQNNFIDETVTFGVLYYYRILPISNAGDGVESNFISIQLILSTPECPLVSASDGLHTDKIVLTWNQINSATNYRVYRNNTEIHNTVQTTFQDTTANQGIIYTYQVKSENQAGLCSPNTNTTNTDTGWAKLSPPQGLVASDQVSETEIQLNWASVQNAQFYNVYRRPAITGTTFQKIASVNNTTYFDTNTDLQYNTTYVYKVRSVFLLNGVERESNDSNTDTGILKNPIPTKPVITVSQGEFTDKITINWNVVTHANEYHIHRDGVLIQVVTGNENTTYDDFDSSVLSCNSYTYSVRAVTIFGDFGDLSDPISGYKTIEIPTGVTATNSQFDNKIVVSWTSVSGANKYEVYRSTVSTTASMSLIATVTGTNYDDTNTDLITGTTYFYSIKAICDTCSSCDTSPLVTDFSVIDSGILDDPTIVIPPPNTPTGLTATSGLVDKVILSWNAVTSTPLSGYKIFRNGIQIQTTTSTSFDDTTAPKGVQQTYTIKAFNAFGVSSDSSSAVGFIKLNAPNNVIPSKFESETYIKLTWTASPGAVSYKIFRDTSRGTSGTLIATVDAASTEFFDTNTDLSYDTPYYYKIISVASFSPGADSSQSVVPNSTNYGILKDPTPTAFVLTAEDSQNTSYVDLSWSSSQYAFNSYIVKRDGSNIGSPKTNYLRNSNTFDSIPPPSPGSPSVAWSLYNSATINNTTVDMTPSTTNNDFGKLLTFTTSNSNNGIFHRIPARNSTTYTISVYARTTSGTNRFRFSYFNGSTSVFSSSDSTNDFQVDTTVRRYTWTFTTTSDNLLSNVAITNGSSIGTTNSGGSIVFWGAQLENGSNATELVVTTANPIITNTFRDFTATPGTNHSYIVTATNRTADTNSNSNSGSLKLQSPLLTSVTNNLLNKVTLNWNLVNGASTYSVLRRTVGGSASVIANGITTLTYDDTTATPGTTYLYSVRANTSFSTSGDPGNELSGSIPSFPTNAGDIFENYFSHNQYNGISVTVTDSASNNVSYNHFSYETFYNPMRAINWDSLYRSRDNRYTKQIFYSNKLQPTNNEINYLEKICVFNTTSHPNIFPSNNKIYSNFDVYGGEGSSKYYDGITINCPSYNELLGKTIQTIIVSE